MQIPKPKKRYQNEEYLNFVRMHQSLVNKQSPSVAHHIRWVELTGMRRKPDDTFTVPLDVVAHDMAHNDPRFLDREEVLLCMVRLLSDFIKIKFPMSGKGD